MTAEELAAELKAGMKQMADMRTAMVEGLIEKMGPRQHAHIAAAAALDVFEMFGAALVESGHPVELIRSLGMESIMHMKFKLEHPEAPAEGEQVH